MPGKSSAGFEAFPFHRLSMEVCQNWRIASILLSIPVVAKSLDQAQNSSAH